MNTLRIVLSHKDVEGQIPGLYPFLTFPPWAHPSLRSACVWLDLASGPSQLLCPPPTPKGREVQPAQGPGHLLQRPF